MMKKISIIVPVYSGKVCRKMYTELNKSKL